MSNTQTQNRYEQYELLEADRVMHRATVDAFSEYMATVSGSVLPAPLEAASRLLKITADRFRKHNKGLPRKERWPVPKELTPHQIALLILAYHEVRALPWMDDYENPKDILFVYQDDGPDKGIYISGAYEIAKEFEPGIDFDKETQVVEWLDEDAERGKRCTKKNLVPVNNGIFNCRTKTLMPFSPEYIFLAKSPVDYVPYAENPVLHNADDGTDWDVEGWVEGLCGTPADVKALWQAMKDAIRPHADRDTIVTLYPADRLGRKSCGRSSVCRLTRNLCGEGNYSTRMLINNPAHLWNDPCSYAFPSIVDEDELEGRFVEVHLYQEYITMRKQWVGYDDPSKVFRHHGFAMLCTEKLPKQDFGCFYGKLKPIPLTGDFHGRERAYIKDDYVGRREVLEYVLWRVLNM